jgi:hypothetical protein
VAKNKGVTISENSESAQDTMQVLEWAFGKRMTPQERLRKVRFETLLDLYYQTLTAAPAVARKGTEGA